jgi:hypothetical protein
MQSNRSASCCWPLPCTGATTPQHPPPAPSSPACSNGETFQDPAYAAFAIQTPIALEPTEVRGNSPQRSAWSLAVLGAAKCSASRHGLHSHLRCPATMLPPAS